MITNVTVVFLNRADLAKDILVKKEATTVNDMLCMLYHQFSRLFP